VLVPTCACAYACVRHIDSSLSWAALEDHVEKAFESMSPEILYGTRPNINARRGSVGGSSQTQATLSETFDPETKDGDAVNSFNSCFVLEAGHSTDSARLPLI
jgi:hypothetical protein